MVINHVHHEFRERYFLILGISTVDSIIINSYVNFSRCPGPAGTMPATHSEKRTYFNTFGTSTNKVNGDIFFKSDRLSRKLVVYEFGEYPM